MGVLQRVSCCRVRGLVFFGEPQVRQSGTLGELQKKLVTSLFLFCLN